MQTKRYAASMLALAMMSMAMFIFSSCSEDEGDVDEFANWQEQNEAYWSSLYSATQQKIAGGDDSWQIILSYTKQNQTATEGSTLNFKPEDYIIVHKLENGSGTESPLYTDSVRVHERGQLIPSATYTGGLIFESSWTGTFDEQTSRPQLMRVYNRTTGLATALMEMRRGDHWQVYVPYQLGYGASKATASQASIPAYSTLIYDLRLVDIYHPGDVIPAVGAKQHR